MIIFLSLSFSLISSCAASIITLPTTQNGELSNPDLRNNIRTSSDSNDRILADADNTDLLEKLEPHLLEFLELIDVTKVVDVVMQHVVKEPDVANFFDFLLSQEFKDIAEQFERLPEVQEAIQLIRSKVYGAQNSIDFSKSQLDTPSPVTVTSISRNSHSVNQAIGDIIQVLPLNDMKELFKKKIETVPEIAKLFKAISSEEFLDILKRLVDNPKAIEIKQLFENLGLDFVALKKLAKDIFGEYFLKISKIIKNNAVIVTQ